MATLAQFTTQPIIEIANLTTANTARSSPTGVVTASTGPAVAAANGVGKMISQVIVQSTGTNAAGMIRFWISINDGTTWNLIEEIVVTATTPSGTVMAFSATVPGLVGLVLPGGSGAAACLLGATTNNSETFNIIVISGTL